MLVSSLTTVDVALEIAKLFSQLRHVKDSNERGKIFSNKILAKIDTTAKIRTYRHFY